MSHAVAVSDAITPSRGRAVGAFVIFLVAALLIPVGVIGSWASRTVADTDRYVETVTALIDSPEVRAEVSTQLTNILFDALPTGELAKSVLPNNGDALSGIVTQAAKAALQNAVASALASPQARKAWETLNRQIQSNLIAALQGDSNSVFQIKGDAIVLDTGVLIERVRTLLVEQDFAIIGLDDQEWGQKVVLVSTAVDLDIAKIRAHVNQTLPMYCAPKDVYHLPSIPRTAVGKVQRHIIAEALLH